MIWEYDIIYSLDTITFKNYLNKAGEQGWELVQILVLVKGYQLIMKRQAYKS